MSAENAKPEEVTVANKIWQVHAAIDTVYGKGFAKDNPEIVARFMQALATQELVAEVAAVREIIASGSGAITIGIESSVPS